MLNKSVPALLAVAVMVIASPPRCAGVEVALFYAPNLALGGLNGLSETGPLGVKARVTVAESGALRLNAGVGLIKRCRNYTIRREAVPAAINHIRERLERTYVRRRPRKRKAVGQ